MIFARRPIIGSMVKIKMQFPMNMLVTMAQKMWGCCNINVGPGVTLCSMKAPRISAMTTLSGKPRVSNGMNPLHVAALAADSGAATPAIANPLAF